MRKYPEERTVVEYIKEHEDFKMTCEESGVAYFEIDKDYEQEIMKVYEYIEDQSREAGEGL